MSGPVILASGSSIRRQLFENAGVQVEIQPARIDEDAIKAALQHENVSPRNIADHLAEQKAQKIAAKFPEAMVVGCDQVLEFDGESLSKPTSPADAIEQIRRMAGNSHKLHSAAVIFDEAQPVWRQIGTVKLHMRRVSQAYLSDYVERNWDDIRHCVGGYMLEAEGIRLFERIEGDYFHVLGLPFLEILNYLTQRGRIPG